VLVQPFGFRRFWRVIGWLQELSSVFVRADLQLRRLIFQTTYH
jgi:hypothetical protein